MEFDGDDDRRGQFRFTDLPMLGWHELLAAGFGSRGLLGRTRGDGPRWLAAKGSRGRQLDDPQDWVRLEIEAAIKREVRLIPILVEGGRDANCRRVAASLRDLPRRQYVALNPTSLDIRRLVAVLKTALAGRATEEQRSGARTLESPHAADFVDAADLMNEGVRLYRLRVFTEAEAALRKAIRLDPDLADAYNGLGLVLYATKRYPEAEEAYRKAIRLVPDFGGPTAASAWSYSQPSGTRKPRRPFGRRSGWAPPAPTRTTTSARFCNRSDGTRRPRQPGRRRSAWTRENSLTVVC